MPTFTCAVCRVQFFRTHPSTFCSLQCFGRHLRSPEMVEQRFWRKVSKADGDGCWEWTGGRDRDGYGCVGNGRSHRASWVMANGPIPSGLMVLHRCDNPPCVRPSHLFLGTNADNMWDAINKGRLRVKGEDNPKAKLTRDQVVEIRSLAAAGESGVSIARRFSVAKDTIYHILKGRHWKPEAAAYQRDQMVAAQRQK